MGVLDDVDGIVLARPARIYPVFRNSSNSLLGLTPAVASGAVTFVYGGTQ